MAIQANWTEVITPEGAMPGWWARPEAPRAAVLVLPEVFGVNAWVRSVADRLAEQGYAALAISTFWRSAPHLEADYNEAGLALGREHRDHVQADQLRADVAAAAAADTSAGLFRLREVDEASLPSWGGGGFRPRAKRRG